eukprot:TRINITY_DN2953_c0_g1_i1.p1 TRINITY_DN2953_c0_g1~~TRINITY_DN2953_c0_g1_i1.p1  ORF type:complete len:1084 (-),score=231.55 TRINITY_DN2953_c0_g1_i1:1117-4368(-)
MAAQRELCLDGLGIRKIVETPPGIEVLSISGNRLKNLGAIANCLTLKELNLAANKLNENGLAPLAALPELRILNISRNHIRDLGPLFLSPPLRAPSGRAFPVLEVLDVSANAALSDLTATMSIEWLRSLFATGLAVTTLHCHTCNLEVIDLRGCCLHAITDLQALPQLAELMLDGNALLTCEDVVVHQRLKALRMAHNAVEHVSGVQLPALTELDISSNHLSQAPSLAGAPSLLSLVLRANQLSSLSALSELRCLTFLDASHNKLRQVEPSLSKLLRPLRVLLLNSNEIDNVEDVASTLENAGGLSLEHMDLRDNPLSLAFYPYAHQMPAWTWEATATPSELESLHPSSLDDTTLRARDRYRNRLSTLCPSLCSLDGTLLEGQRRQQHTLLLFPPGSSAGSGFAPVEARSAMAVPQRRATGPHVRAADADEVVYSTPPREGTGISGSGVAGAHAVPKALAGPLPPALPAPAQSYDPSDPMKKVDTADAATSPVHKSPLSDAGVNTGIGDAALGRTMRQASGRRRVSPEVLVNLGLSPELLGEAQRNAAAERLPPSSEDQDMVLAAEVAAAMAAAAAASVAKGSHQACPHCQSIFMSDALFCRRCGAQRPQLNASGLESTTWTAPSATYTDSPLPEPVTRPAFRLFEASDSLSPVVDLRAASSQGAVFASPSRQHYTAQNVYSEDDNAMSTSPPSSLLVDPSGINVTTSESPSTLQAQEVPSLAHFLIPSGKLPEIMPLQELDDQQQDVSERPRHGETELWRQEELERRQQQLRHDRTQIERRLELERQQEEGVKEHREGEKKQLPATAFSSADGMREPSYGDGDRKSGEESVEMQEKQPCPGCGNIYAADAMFCRKCGQKRSREGIITAAAAAPVAAAAQANKDDDDARSNNLNFDLYAKDDRAAELESQRQAENERKKQEELDRQRQQEVEMERQEIQRRKQEELERHEKQETEKREAEELERRRQQDLEKRQQEEMDRRKQDELERLRELENEKKRQDDIQRQQLQKLEKELEEMQRQNRDMLERQRQQEIEKNRQEDLERQRQQELERKEQEEKEQREKGTRRKGKTYTGGAGKTKAVGN